MVHAEQDDPVCHKLNAAIPQGPHHSTMPRAVLAAPRLDDPRIPKHWRRSKPCHWPDILQVDDRSYWNGPHPNVPAPVLAVSKPASTVLVQHTDTPFASDYETGTNSPPGVQPEG